MFRCTLLAHRPNAREQPNERPCRPSEAPNGMLRQDAATSRLGYGCQRRDGQSAAERPRQARTLYRVAEGLNVSADEFFQPNPGEPQERARNIADLDLHHKIAQLLTSEEGDLLVELVQVLYNHSTRQRRCGYPR